MISTCSRCKSELKKGFGYNEEVICDRCCLEAVYDNACAVPSDINEHLPLLRELASKCKHVTEFGMRWATGSTIAFLAAQPETFISWDLDPEHVVAPRVAELVSLRGKTRFQPRCGDTLKIRPIERTDLLFIDTLHTAKQLIRELKEHADPRTQNVTKYLAFHDTVTFGKTGEDGSFPGLKYAIREFQRLFAFPLWDKLHDLDNNNGLVVLKHICADGHAQERRKNRCTACGQIPIGE